MVILEGMGSSSTALHGCGMEGIKIVICMFVCSCVMLEVPVLHTEDTDFVYAFGLYHQTEKYEGDFFC